MHPIIGFLAARDKSLYVRLYQVQRYTVNKIKLALFFKLYFDIMREAVQSWHVQETTVDRPVKVTRT